MRAIDLFAGWGGFTLGAELAGVRVVWASNHWPLAVDAHAKNHPGAEHVCQDLCQADWRGLPDYDLLLASPECRAYSYAGQPGRSSSERCRQHHASLRSTPWAIVSCAEVTRPRAIVVENVPNFARWPLFSVWCEALRKLGYQLQTRVLRASVHSDTPQRRDRLFVVATRKGAPGVLRLPRNRVEPAFGPCIDWRAGDWRAVSSASAGARRRIRDAIARCGTRCLSQHVTGHKGVGLDEPIRTITTQDQWVVVRGRRYRPLTVRETARAMGFPDTYRWPAHAGRREAIVGLGNAVPPDMARRVIERVAGVAS